MRQTLVHKNAGLNVIRLRWWSVKCDQGLQMIIFVFTVKRCYAPDSSELLLLHFLLLICWMNACSDPYSAVILSVLLFLSFSSFRIAFWISCTDRGWMEMLPHAFRCMWVGFYTLVPCVSDMSSKNFRHHLFELFWIHL